MKLNWRVWLLIAVLALSLLAINPRFDQQGLAVTAVIKDSASEFAGVQGPTNAEQPVFRERVISLNGFGTPDMDAYRKALATIQPGTSVRLGTTKDSYILEIPEDVQVTEELIGLRLAQAATSNVRKGLDLTGGARVLLTPTEPVDGDTLELVLENINQRLNVFGLSDVIVRPTRDFEGNQYILVEIAGANEQEIVELLSSQGNFEAKIGETVVFTGGEDVTYVGRSPSDSGIRTCSPTSQGYTCQFFFVISLSAEAAQRQADATRSLTILPGSAGEAYLSEPLGLFLDGDNISSLQIAATLQGRAETQIQISGSGSATTQESAVVAAQAEMRQLQTLLTTGSLPVDLEIVKTDAISPLLGPSFIRNIFLVGAIALFAVILVVVFRYRDWRISIPMVVTMFSELIIILGIAALIRWNLDLAAIAGIIIAIGTGVDDQIIIVDEIKAGNKTKESWVNRIKKAFFVIFAAFFTLLAAMLPLMWAGAGLVRGFAITTILGVTIGVLVTRPAFAAIAEKLIKNTEDA